MRFIPEHIKFQKPTWDKKFAWGRVYLKDKDVWVWLEFVKRKRHFRTVETPYFGMMVLTTGLLTEYYSIDYVEPINKLEVVKNDIVRSDDDK